MASLPANPLRVLVVEDEPLFAEQLEAALEDLGYQLLGPASSAAEALVLARQPHALPDVAVLDINLRGSTDGVELARQLLAERPLPLIFMTSRSDDATFARARALTPAAYLVKPLDEAALRRAIELAVANFALAGRAAGLPDEDEEEADSPDDFFQQAGGALLQHTLFVKEEGLLVKIKLADLMWVAAEGKNCRLALPARTLSVRIRLRELVEHLPAKHFVQIQRSYIINAECIERLDPVRNLVQVCGQLLPVSRLYRDALLKRLHLVG